MRRSFLFLLACLGTLSFGWADTPLKRHRPPSPWLTGPLLTPSGHVIPSGRWNFEPYLYATAITGAYNSKWKTVGAEHNFYNYLAQVPIEYGFAKDWDFQVVPQWAWSQTKGASSWTLGDFPIVFDYQVLMDSPNVRWPAIRIAFQFNLPFGKYQRLNPRKLGTDVGGSGNLHPSIALVLSRLFYLGGPHFLGSRFYAGYQPPVPVHVHGLNAYGGGRGTRGKVFPGGRFKTLIGLEYTLAQKWALAFDAQYVHQDRNRFSGHTTLPMRAPSSEQFSIAPGLEYNWSPYVGIIAGAWFTVAGRNTGEFVSGIIAINIYK